MSITPEEKSRVIEQYRTHPQDTGSPDVQIAILTFRIKTVTEHLKIHAHDFHTRRGLLQMVSTRRSLLDYVKRIDINRYKDLIQRLELRR